MGRPKTLLTPHRMVGVNLSLTTYEQAWELHARTGIPMGALWRRIVSRGLSELMKQARENSARKHDNGQTAEANRSATKRGKHD
jgi:hypothetical protein